MENAGKPLPPTALIAEAMSRLAGQTKKDPLGYSQGTSANLEKKFQKQLCVLLNEQTTVSGWTWQQEVRYRTRALRNQGFISVDIVGKYRDSGNSAAIELKYVPTRQKDNRAPNPLAFPYDLLKDCLKVELISTEHCKPIEQNSQEKLVFGYSIGLTNVSGILHGTMQGWSQNFLAILQPGEAGQNGNDFLIGPCMIEAFSPNALDKVLYVRKRHHISLGMNWTGKWTWFGDTAFRYVMLSTKFDNMPRYLHCIADSRVIPFLTDEVRDDALRKAADLAEVTTPRRKTQGFGKDLSPTLGQKKSPDTSVPSPADVQKIEDDNITEQEYPSVINGQPAHLLPPKKQTLWRVLAALQTNWPAWQTVNFPEHTDNHLQMRRGESMASIRLLNNVMQSDVCGVAMRLILLSNPGDHDLLLALSKNSVDSLRSNGIHQEMANGRRTLKQEIAFDITEWEGLNPENSNRIATAVVEGMMKFREIVRKTMEREGIEAQVAGWFSQE